MLNMMREIQQIPHYERGLAYCQAVAKRLATISPDDRNAADQQLREDIIACFADGDEEKQQDMRGALNNYDLTTNMDLAALCFELLPTDVRQLLEHHIYGVLVAYRVLNAEDYKETPLVGLLEKIKKDQVLAVDGRPAAFMEPKQLINSVLAAIRQVHKEVSEIRSLSDAFVITLLEEIYREATDSIERIERKLAVLRPMKQSLEAALPPELRELMGGGQMELVGGAAIPMGSDIGQLLKELIGGAGDDGEEEEEDEDGVDELMARERITAAVTEHFDAEDERSGLWSIHPERLHVDTPEGMTPLLQGVMDEQMTTEEIKQAITAGAVTYHERVPSSA